MCCRHFPVQNRKMLEIRNPDGRLVWGTGPALRITLLASAVAAAALYYRHALLPGFRGERMQAAEYLFILSASTVLVALYAGFAERWRLHRFLQSSGLIFLFSVLLAAGVYKLGMHQFGGFDEGLVVHAATYYSQGLKPYIDFPCTMPPLFMAGIRGCVNLLGLRWSSFALMTSAFAALTAFWMFMLLRATGMPRHWVLAVTIGVEMSTMLMSPFWWYNNTSYLSVILLLASVLACLQQQKPVLPWISLAMALAMVLCAKPNVAPSCFMMLPLLATKEKSSWLKTFVACAGALSLGWLICYAAQMPPAALLSSYIEVGKLRGSPLALVPFTQMGFLEGVAQSFVVIFFAVGFAALCESSAKRLPHYWRQLSVCVIAALTALLLASTNAEYKISDLSILLVAGAFLCIHPWKPGELSAVRKTSLVAWLSVFLVMSGFFAVIHLRILGIGPRMFYEPYPTTTIQSGFFSGLEAGPRLQRVLSQTSQVFSNYPSQRVFFGPRMEFEYAVFNKAALSGMPLLWDVGNLFSEERFPLFLSNFQKQDPDLLIFLKGDYTRMGPVASYIKGTTTYRRIETYSELTVYVRNREVPVTYIRLPPAISAIGP